MLILPAYNVTKSSTLTSNLLPTRKLIVLLVVETVLFAVHVYIPDSATLLSVMDILFSDWLKLAVLLGMTTVNVPVGTELN